MRENTKPATLFLCVAPDGKTDCVRIIRDRTGEDDFRRFIDSLLDASLQTDAPTTGFFDISFPMAACSRHSKPGATTAITIIGYVISTRWRSCAPPTSLPCAMPRSAAAAE